MQKKNRYIIAIFSLIVGIAVATQLKANVEDYAPITMQQIENTRTEIDNIKRELDELYSIIEVKKEELEVLENISKGDENIIDVLENDLYMNMISSLFSNFITHAPIYQRFKIYEFILNGRVRISFISRIINCYLPFTCLCILCQFIHPFFATEVNCDIKLRQLCDNLKHSKIKALNPIATSDRSALR